MSPVTASSGHGARLVRFVAFAALLLIPLRVLGRGYLPPDDALRHAAKAASGRLWSEILVLRPEITMDSHPGWHAVLAGVHHVTGWGAHSLVLLSVAGLFFLLSLVPLLLMRRPEAWLLALLAALIADPQLVRIMLGRPFLVSQAVLVLVCLLGPRLEGERLDRKVAASLAAALAASAWLHGSPYLWLLPIGSFFVAGRPRAGARLAACAAVGVVLGALLTGSPLRHLEQQFVHAVLALGGDEPSVTLVGEFQPFAGAPMVVALVVLLLIWRRAGGRPNDELLRDPVFVLALLGWALGFVAVRFYSDWAMPALLVLVAREIEEALEEGAWTERARLGLTACAATVLFLAFTADTSSRWTGSAGEKFLARDDPQHAQWLPAPGGVLYSADMSVFYRTFFRNPDAPWRYILGFEPGWMPAEDLETYREIRRSKGATESYAPWVEKMRREDRLVIKLQSNAPPPVPGLEWYQVEFAIWSGRLPVGPPTPSRAAEPRP